MPTVLFKDKLNFKGPGGGGFLPHQDITAYASDNLAELHISAMVAIDAAPTPKHGPLEFVGGMCDQGILPNEHGVIVDSLVQEMEWRPLLVQPGDIVLFDSRAPHRSSKNETDQSRRLAYLTYNKLSEGDLHAKYYKMKLDVFRANTGGTISVNRDFGGTIV